MMYLRNQETAFDPLSQRHGEVPYDQGLLWHTQTQLIKELVTVLLVVSDPTGIVSTKPNTDAYTKSLCTKPNR